MKKQHCIMLAALLAAPLQLTAQEPLTTGFDHPQDSCRTKVWWFLGETETTRSGITADLEAFRRQGVGGVVYYDQVHGQGIGADTVFSSHWWQSLIFASQEARRLGLTFEANIGNGYVAGGRWITPDCSMQRLAMSQQVVSSTGQQLRVKLPLPPCPRDWHRDVALLAIPYNPTLLADSRLLRIEPIEQGDSAVIFDFGQQFTARSISYEATRQGKARTSSMQVPPTHRPLLQPDTTQFYGCGYRELPDIGMLEVSDDGATYRPVCRLRPKYQTLGGVRSQTIAFPTTKGRFFRLRLTQPVKLENTVVSARARIDRWEERAALTSDYPRPDDTPLYNKVETLQANDIVDLTHCMAPDGTLTWLNAPQGQWLLVRLVAVTTGGRTKHGRREAMGLECDKLSVEGARQHWQAYTKPLIDSLRHHNGALQGICMDSHEAGPQNWTRDMEQQFLRLRGYSLRPYLPTIADGLIINGGDTARDSYSMLKDLRRTISDLVTRNYYGEFQRLCHAEGLTLTAQAIGGAMSMIGDAIEVKRLIDKPQGEFWGYQTEGNYDIKECSSAAHLYGKPIASGEAFTDITYRHSLADIKNLADAAYAFGINEFVVCAVAYQPWVRKGDEPLRISTANGRQYVLNRLNTLWPLTQPFWDYQARCTWMLRQGMPVADVALYLGDDLPTRILSHRLPPLPQGYDFDALGTDALLNRLTVTSDGRLQRPDGATYSLLVLPTDGHLSPAVKERIADLRRRGVPIYKPAVGDSSTQQPAPTLTDCLRHYNLQPDVDAPHANRLYFCHRRTGSEDIYFLNNHSDAPLADTIRFRTTATQAQWWDAVTGRRTPLPITTSEGRTAVYLTLEARESGFVVLYHTRVDASAAPSGSAASLPTATTTLPPQPINGPWTVTFDPLMGGPSTAVTFDSLASWTAHCDPRIKYYSGTAVYRNSFTLSNYSQATHTLHLQLQNAAAEVIVNGHKAGTVWCAPWSIDISHLLREGANSIEIRVASTLWNRLVGDACTGEAQRLTWQTHPLAKPTDALTPSGLTAVTIVSHQLSYSQGCSSDPTHPRNFCQGVRY